MITYAKLQMLTPRAKHRLAGMVKQLGSFSDKYPADDDLALSNEDMIAIMRGLNIEVDDLKLGETEKIWHRLKMNLEEV